MGGCHRATTDVCHGLVRRSSRVGGLPDKVCSLAPLPSGRGLVAGPARRVVYGLPDLRERGGASSAETVEAIVAGNSDIHHCHPAVCQALCLARSVRGRQRHHRHTSTQDRVSCFSCRNDFGLQVPGRFQALEAYAGVGGAARDAADCDLRIMPLCNTAEHELAMNAHSRKEHR